jgi:hypothetical protein
MLISGNKINCLILAERFNGWGKDSEWGGAKPAIAEWAKRRKDRLNEARGK